MTAQPKLSYNEFNQLSKLVYEECGNKMPPAKKILLESRLHKRLRALNMQSFKDYLLYLTGKDGMTNELVHMIDVVTTNKTDFFREAGHFEYLTRNVLPQLVQTGNNRVNIWSSACSSGEEPFTLAMVMDDYIRKNPRLDYTIFASDISTKVLEKAALAVYPIKHAEDIPIEFRKKYLLKSKEKDNPTIRIVPELRRKVRFARVNLMETLPFDEKFDIIFCRNVLIYFDRPTQLHVVGNLAGKLKKGGHLFIGHSESLFQMDLPITQVAPTIYVKK